MFFSCVFLPERNEKTDDKPVKIQCADFAKFADPRLITPKLSIQTLLSNAESIKLDNKFDQFNQMLDSISGERVKRT